MALSAANVMVGRTGAISVAPAGSTAPTDSTTALDAAYVDLGYAHTDAVGLGIDDSTTDIVAWQGGDVVRTLTTQSTYGVNFTLLEAKTAVLSEFFAGSTIAAGQIDVKSFEPVRKQWVIDVDDEGVHWRFSFGAALLVSRGDVDLTRTDAAGWPFELRAFKDANENFFQIFTDAPGMA